MAKLIFNTEKKYSFSASDVNALERVGLTGLVLSGDGTFKTMVDTGDGLLEWKTDENGQFQPFTYTQGGQEITLYQPQITIRFPELDFNNGLYDAKDGLRIGSIAFWNDGYTPLADYDITFFYRTYDEAGKDYIYNEEMGGFSLEGNGLLDKSTSNERVIYPRDVFMPMRLDEEGRVVSGFNELEITIKGVKETPLEMATFRGVDLSVFGSFVDGEYFEEPIENFKSLKIKEQINILSDDLPINSLECEFLSFNEVDVDKNMEFDVIHNNDYFGRFYIVDFAKKGKNLYSISANSILGRLDYMTYDSWNIGGYGIPDAIYDATNVPVVFEYQDFYKTHTGYVGVCNGRQALCQYAWAQGVVVDASRRSFANLKVLDFEYPSRYIHNKGQSKIVGDSKLTSSNAYNSANYKLISYDYNKQYVEGIEKTEIGKIVGDFSTTTRYYFDKAPCIFDSVAPNTIKILNHTTNYVDFKRTDGQQAIGVGVAKKTTYIHQMPTAQSELVRVGIEGEEFRVYNVVDGWANIGYEYLGVECFGNCMASDLEITYYNLENNEVIFYGYNIDKSEKSIIIENRTNTEQKNTLNFDKYTLYAIDDFGNPVDIKSNLIQAFVESDGEIDATVVLDYERVGDYVEIETAFSGTFRGIITALEYSLVGYQIISKMKIKVLYVGYEPLLDRDDNFILDKKGKKVFVKGLIYE